MNILAIWANGSKELGQDDELLSRDIIFLDRFGQDSFADAVAVLKGSVVFQSRRQVWLPVDIGLTLSETRRTPRAIRNLLCPKC